jgi:hypothetical protein
MLLSGALFALFLAGCWLYCLTDAALTPAGEYAGWAKRTWIVVIAVTFIAGAIAWLIARRHSRAMHWPPTAVDHLTLVSLGDGLGGANITWYPDRQTPNAADAALARHPAGRSRMLGRQAPIGPDDDPEFLRQLAKRIQGDPA